MKIFFFIQARMSSKRLPGKVLLKIRNKTILEHIFQNLRKSQFKYKIVVLTSKNKEDNKIIKICRKNEIEYFRGNLKNVYKRFIDALDIFKCNAFVRINADSPMINSKIIDKAIKKYKTDKFDIVTNCFPKTFPKGLSVEIIKVKTFKSTFAQVKKRDHFEHITKYFYYNFNKFKIFNIRTNKKKKYSSLAIDNLKDYEFIKREFSNICL